jgi:carboxymethylenebutenolidase
MKYSDVELGFLAVPEGVGTAPGVVIVHDVWGLSDHTRSIATRLASLGFVALAIDLYRRDPEVQVSEPGRWMRAMSDPEVLDDLRQAAELVKGVPESNGRVGVVGFCMGGMYALMAGCSRLGFSAAVPFYGLLSHRHGILYDPDGLDPAKKPREPLAMASALSCPLLAFFGDQDTFIPLSDVAELERGLVRSGVASEVVVVPDAGHAFMNDTRIEAFRPEAAEMAWERMVEFLRAQLS